MATKTKTFTPPDGIGARFFISPPPPRIADGMTEGCYGSVVKGTCLEPEIFDGDMVVADPNRRPEPGEFGVFWSRSDNPPSVKRFVNGLIEFVPMGPGSEVVPLLMVEQLNPPRDYCIAADKLEAAHAVIGWMKPEEYEPLRRPVGAVRSGKWRPDLTPKAMGDRLRVLRQTLDYDSAAAFAAALGYRTRTYLAHERGERSQGAAVHRMTHAVNELTGACPVWLWCGHNRPELRQVTGVDGKPISFVGD